MKAPPKWAQELTLSALLYLRDKQYDISVPLLNWKHKQRDVSSGICRQDSITIIAGKKRVDTKLVLLHELAHWALPIKRGHEGHTTEFWDIAWDLYRWAGLPIRYCLNREKTYRKGAAVAYHKANNHKGG